MGRRGTANQTSENRAALSYSANRHWKLSFAIIQFGNKITSNSITMQHSTFHLCKLLFEWLYRNKKMKSKAQNAKSSQTLKSIGGQKRYRIATPCLILYLSPRCGERMMKNVSKLWQIATWGMEWNVYKTVRKRKVDSPPIHWQARIIHQPHSNGMV